MPTTAAVQTAIQQHRDLAESRYADYEQYLWHKTRADEVTDASERLRLPMLNTFAYSFNEQGSLVTDYGEPLLPVAQTGLVQAQEWVAQDPQFAFEVTRRQLELTEIQAMHQLQAGQGFVVVSPYPDTLRHTPEIGILGYDRKRPRTMVRYIRCLESPNGPQVLASSLSLDTPNYPTGYKGTQAIFNTLGYSLPDSQDSENILAQRLSVPAFLDNDDAMLDIIRAAYDNSLTAQLGGVWQAGRPEISVTDALSFIEQQSDLVKVHVETVLEVMRSVHDATERAAILEGHRYNFAAALHYRSQGKHIDIDDIADAGQTAQADNLSFDPFCPPGATAAAQLSELGYAKGERSGPKRGSCPFCGVSALFDPCASHIKCPNKDCEAEARDGKIIFTGHHNQKVRRVGRQALTGEIKPQITMPGAQKPSTRKVKAAGHITIDGELLRVQSVVAVGGRTTQVVRQNGTVVAEGKAAEAFLVSF